ncbi:glutathione S-transferase [Cupriavidus necator]
MSQTTLTFSSRNYSACSLSGWLLVKFSGLACDEVQVPFPEATERPELLLLASSTLVPCLEHAGRRIWDILAIAEYLHELCPDAGLLPREPDARAHCRSVCSELHAGFNALHSALPMNLRAHFPGFHVVSQAQSDIDRITAIWRECLMTYQGSFLFGARTMAEALSAPVVTLVHTYDVPLGDAEAAYGEAVMALPEMQEWIEAAGHEPNGAGELEAEF